MFDAKFYETISRLYIYMGHKSASNSSGNRKSSQKGSSAEFSDFREYMPGDDLRRIDWNAYGRLDRLYIREYMEEREATVSILIDSSASMLYGRRKKSELACELAAAFSYMALMHMDRVAVYDMKHMERPMTVSGGKQGYARLLPQIEKIEFGGQVDIQESIKRFVPKGSGATIILSDFLAEQFVSDEEDSIKGIVRYLDYHKQRPVLLQLMAQEELEIDLTDTVSLIDMESNDQLKVTMDKRAIDTYTSSLNGFLEKMKRISQNCGADYHVCSTGTDISKLMFEELRSIYAI